MLTSDTGAQPHTISSQGHCARTASIQHLADTIHLQSKHPIWGQRTFFADLRSEAMLVPLFTFVRYVAITIWAFYESKHAYTFTSLNTLHKVKREKILMTNIIAGKTKIRFPQWYRHGIKGKRYVNKEYNIRTPVWTTVHSKSIKTYYFSFPAISIYIDLTQGKKKKDWSHRFNLGNHFYITNMSFFTKLSRISVKVVSCYCLNPSLC